MFLRCIVIAMLACLVTPTSAEQQSSAIPLRATLLEPLPDRFGLGGPFVGVAGDALVVAGGSNFPDGPPWDGHAKAWHDRIYVLTDPHGKWTIANIRLQRACGYGVAVSWRGSMILVGGGNAQQHFAEVISIDRTLNELQLKPLPALPFPLAMHCGALVDDTIYIAGGSSSPEANDALGAFLSLDLSLPPDQRQWRKLPTWPGAPRMLATAASLDGDFYLFGGAQPIATDDGKTTRKYLADAYCYRPAAGWRRLADLPHPLAAAPSPALTNQSASKATIVICGGDEGTLFEKNSQLRDRHPGFTHDCLTYDVADNRWSRSELVNAKIFAHPMETSVLLPVTTGAAKWRGGYTVPSGEIRPATRTTQVLWLHPSAGD